MKTFMFPGQGSQSRGMGRPLFDEFKDLTRKADRILGYSIKELCCEDPRAELNKTQFTQPALYVVNALAYFKRIQESGERPDYLAGHSLGEFNALLAAEVFNFETGLELVRKRGELMSQTQEGAMAAILNASRQEIEDILRNSGLAGIDIANYNSASQIVISGAADEIRKAESLFTGKMTYYPLNTSGAFHSSFMDGARGEFQSYLESFDFEDPKIPVVSNVTARPYRKGEIAANLARQISSTVRWYESIQFLLQLGADAGEAMQFEELGNGDVLTKLARTIRQQAPIPAAASEAAPVPSPAAALSSAVAPSPTVTPSPAVAPAPVAAPQKTTAEARVREWNKVHPVGTRVRARILEDDNKEVETRTEAIVLFGHRAAVYMKGFNGYFDLNEVAPL